MECAQQEQLPSYLDGELPAAQELRLEAHVRRCFPCTEELQLQRRVVALLDTLPHHRAPRDFAAGVLAQVPAARRAASPRHPARAGLTVAALAVATGIVIGLVPVGSATLVLGRLATGWYAWCGDLGGLVTRLQSLSVAEVQPVVASLWGAACAVVAALAAQLVVFWLVTFGVGLGLRGVSRSRRHQLVPF